MSLATQIIVLQPAPAIRLYRVIDAMVNPTGNPSVMEEDRGGIHNRIGQGNRSMLDVTYAIDGPIDEQPAARAEYEKERADYPDEQDYGISSYYAPVPYCIKVRLDTGYGFNEDGIGGCNDLHAAIIMATYAWAAEFGADIMWYNEFSGVWSAGLDGLDEFARNGAEAQEWFQGTVKPFFNSQGFKIND